MIGPLLTTSTPSLRFQSSVPATAAPWIGPLNNFGRSKPSDFARSSTRPRSSVPDSVASRPENPGVVGVAAQPSPLNSALTVYRGQAPARSRLASSRRLRTTPDGARPAQRSNGCGANASTSGHASASRSCSAPTTACQVVAAVPRHFSSSEDFAAPSARRLSNARSCTRSDQPRPSLRYRIEPPRRA